MSQALLSWRCSKALFKSETKTTRYGKHGRATRQRVVKQSKDNI
ncbi:hypothetical protein VDGL01_12604 [Verticillium dahliae]